jgi:ketosteroid isomerase-like protein
MGAWQRVQEETSMARKVLCGVLALGVAAAVVYASAAPTKSATAEVTAVMDQVVKAFESKDMAALSRDFAHDPDMVCFGTDAVERFVGWEALRAAVERQFAAQEKLKAVVHDRVVKVSAGGNVAWVTELWDWDGVSSGEAFNLKNARMTAVLEKRQGHWLIVHTHGSVGVSGQAVKY